MQQDTSRTLEDSMDIGWRVLQMLPTNELTRLTEAQISTYIDKESHG